jgi:UDP-3-O-[3-hydroxymyristoyl] glucosamine N-acyltransferase
MPGLERDARRHAAKLAAWTLAFTAGELAERFGLELRGNAAASVAGVATLANAGHGQLAFLSNPHYRNQLADSAASIAVLRADAADAAPGTVLIARATRIPRRQDRGPVRPKSTQPAGIHPSAVIDPSAHVAPEAHVGPFVCRRTQRRRSRRQHRAA